MTRNQIARLDAMDPELAALKKRFDQAPDLLEAYTQADPWLYGEQAAMNAALAATRGDYDPSIPTAANGGEGPTSPATLAELRAGSARDPLSSFLPLAELEKMSAEERARWTSVIASVVAELRAKSGGGAP